MAYDQNLDLNKIYNEPGTHYKLAGFLCFGLNIYVPVNSYGRFMDGQFSG